MLAEGTKVGGYVVEHLIGEGGMGAVYAAVEPTIGKRVAIKVLRAALSADEATKARFEREARAVNAVRHPSMLEVFAFGQLDDGSPYFVMSLLEGRSLREELDARGRIEPAEAWRILRDVADGLATAHASNVVHRDLKPDNVFLESFPGRPPRPRVLDFGVAKVLDLTAGLGDDVGAAPLAPLTETGAPIGTPTYMAPEQWWSQPTTPRTDQYAFGATLFELLTGKPPFSSKRYADLLQKHLNEPPPTLADRGVVVGDAIETFVARLLAKAPEDRFTDFAEVIERGDAAFAPTPEPVSSSRVAPPSSTRRSGPAPSTRRSEPDLAVAATVPSARAPAQEPLEGPERRATQPADSGLEAPTSGASTASGWSATYLVVLAGVVLAGLAAIYAVGYAGDARRDLPQWIRNSGYSIYPVLAAFAVGVVILARSSRARLVDTSPRYGAVFVALSPLVPSVLATYLGWNLVLSGLRRVEDVPRRFQILNEGMFEVSTPRFVGFGLTAILLLGVSASFGLAPPARTRTSVAIDARERRWSLATALALGAAMVAFGVVGAPSAALVSGAVVVAELVAFAIPTTHPDSAHRDARDRAVAGGAALLLTLGVALARIEGEEAALWDTSATRAIRVRAIVDAAHERTATLLSAALALTVFLAVEIARVRRLRGRERALPMPRSGLVLGFVIVVTAVLDVTFHQLFFAERARLIEAQREQFSLFAKLDPPTSDAPLLHEPHSAPALQVTLETIAIGGKGIARSGALDSPEGRSNVGHDLTNALGAVAGGATDLSLVIDRRVPWARVASLLELACQAGARHAELLFTRGGAPVIARDAPPEAGELLPRDFGALDVTLADEGFDAPRTDAFAIVAARLLERARSVPPPVPLNLGCPRAGR